MSNEYAKALEIANAASAKFGEAQKAYRSLKIGDAEFLAAKDEYSKAEAAFDAAYAKEEEAEESAPLVDDATPDQLELFA